MRGVMGEEDIGKMAEKISSQIWSFSFDDLRVKFDLDCVSSVNIGCDSVSSFGRVKFDFDCVSSVNIGCECVSSFNIGFDRDFDCVSSVNIGCDSVSSFNIGFDRESCVKVSVLVKFEIN